MRDLTIMTFNVLNKYKLYPYFGMEIEGTPYTWVLDEGITVEQIKNLNSSPLIKVLDNTKELADLILKYDVDIIGLQEVTVPFLNRLRALLPEYNIVGEPRYNYIKKPFYNNYIDKYNEANPILTKFEILNSKTYFLPWILTNFKDFFKKHDGKFALNGRVLTEAYLCDPELGCMFFYNTHLERVYPSIRKKQLKRINNIMEDHKDFDTVYPTILTGDFNVDKTNKELINFEGYLSNEKINRVDFDSKSYHDSEKNLEIDQVFYSNHYEVIDKKILYDVNISDHYPLLVKLKLKERA